MELARSLKKDVSATSTLERIHSWQLIFTHFVLKWTRCISMAYALPATVCSEPRSSAPPQWKWSWANSNEVLLVLLLSLPSSGWYRKDSSSPPPSMRGSLPGFDWEKQGARWRTRAFVRTYTWEDNSYLQGNNEAVAVIGHPDEPGLLCIVLEDKGFDVLEHRLQILTLGQRFWRSKINGALSRSGGTNARPVRWTPFTAQVIVPIATVAISGRCSQGLKQQQK